MHGMEAYLTLLGVGHAGTPVAGAVGALLRAQEMGLGGPQHQHGLEQQGLGRRLALVAQALGAAQAKLLKTNTATVIQDRHGGLVVKASAS